MQENDDPIYQQIFTDLLLIGVDHRRIIRPKPRVIKRFEATIDSLDHLAFEGTPQVYEKIKADTYETRAIGKFKGQKHFLHTPRTDYLKNAGLSIYEVLIYESISEMKSVGLQPTQPELRKFAESLRRRQIYQIEDDEIERFSSMFPQLLSRSTNTEAEGYVEATIKFLEYSDQGRDLQMYAPALEQLRTLPGKKGAIFGNKHLPKLANILAGQSETLPYWNDYTSQLEDKARTGSKAIENFALLNLMCS